MITDEIKISCYRIVKFAWYGIFTMIQYFEKNDV